LYWLPGSYYPRDLENAQSGGNSLRLRASVLPASNNSHVALSQHLRLALPVVACTATIFTGGQPTCANY